MAVLRDYHSRFFFWWITALLPMAALGWALALARIDSGRVGRVVVVLLLVLALWPKAHNPKSDTTYLQQWDYARLYERDARVLRTFVHVGSWRGGGSRRRTRVLGFAHGRLYRNAAEQGATFLRRWDLLPD